MDLLRDLNQLKTLREKCENQLKSIGLDSADFPDDVLMLLDKCAQLKMATKLQSLEETMLDEWQFLKRKEKLDQNHVLAKLKEDIRRQEVLLAKEKQDVLALKTFIHDVNSKRLVSEAEMERKKIIVEEDIKNWNRKCRNLQKTTDFDIEGLIQKLEFLKSKQTKEASHIKPSHKQ